MSPKAEQFYLMKLARNIAMCFGTLDNNYKTIRHFKS